MKKMILLLLLLILSACSDKTIQTTKSISLTQEKVLPYFFYTEGIDTAINEPFAEVESDLYASFLNSREKFLMLKNFKSANILTRTSSYILIFFRLDNDTFAGTFKPDGTPINFILLEKSFGTNEFSVQRSYKQLSKNTFSITDKRYDVEWVVFPTKGVNKLTNKAIINIYISNKGFFLIQKNSNISTY